MFFQKFGDDRKEQGGVRATRNRKKKKKLICFKREEKETGAQEQLKDATNILEEGIISQAHRHTGGEVLSLSA